MDLSFLKPNCKSFNPPASAKCDSRRSLITRSKNLPTVLRRQINLYDDGYSNSLLPLRNSTNFAVFQSVGKTPSLIHELNTSRSSSDLVLDTRLTIRTGTLSSPGALPSGILLLHSLISAFVTSGNCNAFCELGQFMIVCLGKSVFTISYNRPGSVSPVIGFLPTRLLITIL